MPLLDIAREALAAYLQEQDERQAKMTALVQAGRAAHLIVDEYAKQIGVDSDWRKTVTVTVQVALTSHTSITVNFTLNTEGELTIENPTETNIKSVSEEHLIERIVRVLMIELDKHRQARATN